MRAIAFRSTRSGGKEPAVPIDEAVFRGMPRDGGLYVPTRFPPLPRRVFDLKPLSYSALALLVLQPFFSGWEEAKLRSIIERAYGSSETAKDSRAAARGSGLFDRREIAPLTPLPKLGAGGAGGGAGLYLLELFHGRTGAFKDMALSLLGGFLRESMDRQGLKQPLLVLTATSGDTGSAALEGLGGVEGLYTAVFYPAKGTSEIQRLQMTTASAGRRFVAGIKGDFDEAQSAVKRIFARAGRGEGPLAGLRLSSANSINIGRLLPQIVYYVAAWRALAAQKALGEGGIMHVAVPTGNFGDILAAKYAKEMGLPIGALICASNENKVLADFFETGLYDRRRALVRTESPSMDILVSSNLERLLFMASRENPGRVLALMRDLSAQGRFSASKAERDYMSDFRAGWCGDAEARSTIAKVWTLCDILIDPHTATAVNIALRLSDSLQPKAPVVTAATASPFKFPAACLGALVDSGALRPGGVSKGGGEEGTLGDLGIAAALSEATGKPLPPAIGALAGKPVLHDSILEADEVESVLGGYARAAMREGS